jgi:hypothetical protein
MDESKSVAYGVARPTAIVVVAVFPLFLTSLEINAATFFPSFRWLIVCGPLFLLADILFCLWLVNPAIAGLKRRKRVIQTLATALVALAFSPVFYIGLKQLGASIPSDQIKRNGEVIASESRLATGKYGHPCFSILTIRVDDPDAETIHFCADTITGARLSPGPVALTFQEAWSGKRLVKVAGQPKF